MSEAGNVSARSKRELENCEVEAAYARWAPVYDLLFATLLRPGRRAVASIASKNDGFVLDVGVGTGLELPLFARGACVFGVDLSEPMLRRAAHRISRHRLGQVAGLSRMDATRLAFPDGCFACVVAPYMLTVVPEPESTLDELARVVRTGGEIVLVNHVSSEDTALAALESWIGRRLAAKLGWRPKFPWAVIGDWLEGRPDMRLLERRLLPPLGLFTLVRIERIASPARGAAPVDAPSLGVLEHAPA